MRSYFLDILIILIFLILFIILIIFIILIVFINLIILIREGCRKSKWKFKMAFAMKGGGARGGLECHLPILKNDFFKNHLESFPDCENVFCT